MVKDTTYGYATRKRMACNVVKKDGGLQQQMAEWKTMPNMIINTTSIILSPQ